MPALLNSVPKPALTGEKRMVTGTWLVLGVAAIMRVVLVLQGGQFFFPDESRYYEAVAAVDKIVDGKWSAGLALPFEGGDHAGFKLLSVIPAGLQRVTGPGKWVPSLFFASFSWVALFLLGLMARRLSGSEAERFAVTVAAATSATLFYYSRHMLPYDASLCLVLLALYLALVADGAREKWLMSLAGFSAGCAALVYYGYWVIGGIVLAIGVQHGAKSWIGFLRRAALGLAGLVVPFAGAWTVNRVWGNGQLVERAQQFSRTITTGGDYRGAVAPAEFLFTAEGSWFVFAMAALVLAIWQWVRAGRRTPGGISPTAKLAVVGCGLVWVTFIVTGDLLHRFVVYGRLARQLTPFLCLALGAASIVLWRGRWRPLVAGAWVLALLGFAWQAWRITSMPFPVDFHARWQPQIEAKQRAIADGASYYRTVNVANFIYEPEVLPAAPLETVAAAEHPYNFVPFLFEGYSPAERRLRGAIDHRMRVVRMAVPPRARVKGEAQGMVTLQVRFGERRGGYADPLLSVGEPRSGALFFVRYETDNRVWIGCEVIGAVVLRSPLLEIEPGRAYTLQLYAGGLGLGAEADQLTRNQVWATIDGREIISRVCPMPKAGAGTVFAGVNVAAASSAGLQFHGEVLDVQRGGSPPVREQMETKGGYGAVLLRVTPPTSHSNRPEPLVVVGEIGRAVLGFAIPLADGRVILGAEIWGVGYRQSAPLKLLGDGKDEIIYSFGSLLPVPGDAEWSGVPLPVQAQSRERLSIRLNGKMVLDENVPTPELSSIVPSLGVNPLGGSLVGESYSGKILHSERLPPAKSVSP